MSDLKELSPIYSPREIEEKWYQFWLANNFFHAEVNEKKKPFCIVIPPPNVTGILHLGHALDNTMQDILIRWRRMQGYEALWLPGTDHAGIATQAKVEESLAKEGLSRYDIGREKFLERTWAWKEKYGGTIINQLKRLGASCDWGRERFTMDEGCSAAVREVFIRLYEKGLIYRGEYIINWCPKCHTTISDIEVEHEEKETNLWHIKYPFKDGSGYVVVATTRPETMLGDTAVAVNPKDERYTGLVGKTVILPIVNREIPLIADDYVDPAFGTGAVKVTPAHDPNDFEMGKRHNLQEITVIDLQGKMTAHAGKYEGLPSHECRKKIIAELKETGVLIKEEPYLHSVGQCYRCDTVIEPLISKQWFVRMKPLAEPAMEAVKDGRIEFVPERFTKIYLNWLENIRDWCISRQLWWGHRIPVWYCQDCQEIIASRTAPEKCPKCGSTRLEQDPDVLDTWFSSALWPFSTLGWPEKTPELEYFYPTSVLVTGRDIIFFWVARMIFMALEFMNRQPFHKVMIHGLILDPQGKKMSKSRGNSVDPLEMVEKYGADSLRFMLITGNTPGQDIRFHMERVEAARNFNNKIWNATRFVLMNLEGYTHGKPLAQLKLTIVDRWILSRLQKITAEVTRQLERFELGAAAAAIYEFLWNEYCDWFIEMAKPRLKGDAKAEDRETAQAVLTHVLAQTLVLLHPFMPFVTEELWQHLPHTGESVMVAPWPEVKQDFLDENAETQMGLIMEVTKAIRNTRAEFNMPPAKKIPAFFFSSPQAAGILKENMNMILNLAGLDGLEPIKDPAEKPAKAVTAIARDVTVYLPLAGIVDLDKETARLNKELANLQQEIDRLNQKLDNAGFIAKAPAEVVEKERQKLQAYKEKHLTVQNRLQEME